MSNLVPALKAELAELERELQADPRYRKIARIRDLLRDYAADDGTAREHKPSLFTVNRSEPSEGGLGSVYLARKQASKIERVKSEIRALLTEKHIAHRKEILIHLTNRGVMGHEKDPMASLAAYLSGFKDDFVFDGNGNYSLKPS